MRYELVDRLFSKEDVVIVVGRSLGRLGRIVYFERKSSFPGHNPLVNADVSAWSVDLLVLAQEVVQDWSDLVQTVGLVSGFIVRKMEEPQQQLEPVP